MRKIILFLCAFITWILLVWPVDPETGVIYFQDIIAGIFVAALVALVMRDISLGNPTRWLSPVRWIRYFEFLFVFVYYVILANIDVAYRVLHPAMPIRPGIVRIKTRLKNPSSITLLANSITLTPGTLTVDVTDDHDLYVHWINIKTLDEEEIAKKIIGRFEKLIKQILE